MKIKSIGIGPHRWYIEIWPNGEQESLEFCRWMTDNFPNCFFKRRQSPDSHTKYFWEVRGSNYEEHTVIMLAWA
jgi:hypothetical protein